MMTVTNLQTNKKNSSFYDTFRQVKPCAGYLVLFGRVSWSLPQMYQASVGLFLSFAHNLRTKPMQNLIEHLLTSTLVNERKRLERNLRRAEQKGAPATLTLFEWIKILDHFEWRCAYCKKAPAETMEHDVPLRNGGGTTADNCFPLCTACHRQQNTLEDRSESARNRLVRLLS